MNNPLRAIPRILRRWSQEQEAVVLQMTQRKTIGGRLNGLSKSKRIEAKFMLLGFAPMALGVASDVLGFPRGTLWEVWFWVCMAWLAFVVFIALAAVWRGVRRAQKLKG